MTSEPSSVFKRFDYTEDWEEQIQEYIELVQSCEVDEVTVQESAFSQRILWKRQQYTTHIGSDFHQDTKTFDVFRIQRTIGKISSAKGMRSTNFFLCFETFKVEHVQVLKPKSSGICGHRNA